MYSVAERVHPETGTAYLSPFARPWEVPGARVVIGQATPIGPVWRRRIAELAPNSPVLAPTNFSAAVQYLRTDPALFRRTAAPAPIPNDSRIRAVELLREAAQKLVDAGYPTVSEEITEWANVMSGPAK